MHIAMSSASAATHAPAPPVSLREVFEGMETRGLRTPLRWWDLHRDLADDSVDPRVGARPASESVTMRALGFVISLAAVVVIALTVGGFFVFRAQLSVVGIPQAEAFAVVPTEQLLRTGLTTLVVPALVPALLAGAAALFGGLLAAFAVSEPAMAAGYRSLLSWASDRPRVQRQLEDAIAWLMGLDRPRTRVKVLTYRVIVLPLSFGSRSRESDRRVGSILLGALSVVATIPATVLFFESIGSRNFAIFFTACLTALMSGFWPLKAALFHWRPFSQVAWRAAVTISLSIVFGVSLINWADPPPLRPVTFSTHNGIESGLLLGSDSNALYVAQRRVGSPRAYVRVVMKARVGDYRIGEALRRQGLTSEDLALRGPP